MLSCVLYGQDYDPPDGYYDNASGLTGTALRNAVYEIINDHTWYPYTSGSTDTWDILDGADQDPDNSSNILDVYLNASYTKEGGGNSNYNREHTWPKSYGFHKEESYNYPYTDCHALFLAFDNYNSSRTNKPYDDCDENCTEKITEVNNNWGGGSGSYPGNSNWTDGGSTTGDGSSPSSGDKWETWKERQGDVARALFYLDVRYAGDDHGSTGEPEPDLILTDNLSEMVCRTETHYGSSANVANTNDRRAYMGLLSTLIQWHEDDPVDAVEQRRNHIVYGYQGNRNPFIDNPTWVNSIFGLADIIITEIADPNDDTGARYIEIHNSGGSSVTLTDYYIIRFTNGNSAATSNIDLSSYTLAAGDFLIFAVNSTTFSSTFSAGSATVVDAASGGPADSNGDDNLAIVTEASEQTFDHTDSDTYDIVDMFGVVGEDGSGIWHEFEDGRAERVSTATSASGATASSSDWNCWSDSDVYLAGTSQGSTNAISTTTAYTSNGFDPGAWDGYRSVSISGDGGFRMMSSPVAGQIYSDLLSELWTQGMTSADVTSGDANVWTYDGSSWSALDDITGSGSGASLTAGQGFLVYVYADTDNDGDDDLPVTLSVSGTENSSSATVPSSGSIADEAWELAGNPYAQTIDWDDVTQNAVTTSCYVYDDAKSGGAGYISWNGSTGSLTDGLIAPFQGFWAQGDGGTGSITIETADKSSSSGTFYKTMTDSTGSMSFSISSGNYSDKAFVSFMTDGAEGMDNADAYKLLPISPSDRVVAISYAEGNGLDISNLPYSHEGSIAISLDVMYLTLDDDYNFVTNENEVTMSWDLSSLPETVTSLTLTDNTSGSSFDLDEQSEVTFKTVEKGNFPSYGSGGVNIYPVVGESQFTLTVAYGSAGVVDEPVPTEFALYPAYPNPFNPSVTLQFNIETHGYTSLYIYDITGRLVEILVDGKLESGEYEVVWDARVLPSGIYLAQLKSGERAVTQKLTLLK